ncbi:ornithine carbamoyltransferase [Fibrobacter sp. UWH9]|uniref:ornithine carbamoyltransferase n=1 Tax=unclassified Fibrobacter TaxID=2634177 RepID=UPI000919C99E|nr:MULTISPECIES: ornithine carbamoyltransferase [unclassified Fibrobacter]MCQ2100239.1 ornithine carbamoyltransferase [Fibrobacter sp.]MDO4946682.1 ornithine carbamoyltransferase [Fibrobacter sp.]OWV04970.1 ornithine carbamoyltransferase [Fibrobacter sp. UWH3]OWV11255.1 ornithine carbamoyltransferase [Fibrobacter sp. UWH1]SHG30840.1 ornithine carbamoyltransferase [Fibrobacter sp. UWH9]
MIDRSKHFLRLADWSEERILETVAIASRLKKEVHAGQVSDRLHGQNIGMFFEKPSLRTITTFQVGMNQLGGHAVLLSPDSIGLGKRESIKDVARCLSRWVNALVVRCFKQDLVEQLAEYGSIPVVNALTDDYHPCQAIAFAQMIEENLGGMKGKTVAFIGDGNNVANSFLALCSKVGMNFTLACPKGFEQPAHVIEEAQADFKRHGCQYRVFNDPKEAVKDADILYSDVWVSMGQEGQKESKQNHFLPFRIDADLLKYAPSHVKVSHCLPAHRGDEITDEVMDNLDLNMSYEEAENRLHAHKAVLWQVMPPFNK